MAWLRLALRRLRDDRAATAGLAALVLVTALVAALAPRVLATLADDSLQSGIADAVPVARNIQLLQHLVVGRGTDADPLALVRAAGLEREQTFPAAVRRLITDRSVVAETGRFRLTKPTTDPAYARLRVQEGIASHLRYVEGVAPGTRVATRDDVGPEHLSGVPVYEVGVSRATAERFGLAVGDTVELLGDPGDPLIGRTGDIYAYATVSGIYEVVDPASDYWLDDPTPIHPVIRALSAEVQFLDAAFVVADGTHGALGQWLSANGRDLSYDWRSFLDPGRLRDATMDPMIVAFRRLQVRYPSANVSASADTALRTGMLQILEAYRARWTAAQAIIAVMALGPALVALGTLALVAVLAAARRRSTMGLARSRGASGAQVVVPVLVEGLLIAVPAAALAVALAMVLVPAGRTATTLIAVGIVVGVAVGVLLWTVVGIVRGFGQEPRAGTRIVRGPSSRRVMAEVLLVVAAIGGALLLRERGLGAVPAASGGAGIDPLIAAVPGLVGVAAGIVVVRLVRLPLAAVAWLAARGRGLVAMLAMRRAREGGASSAVLLVLLATATVGAFAVTSLDQLDRGADVAAWQEVGGPYRLQQPSGPLPAAVDAATLPGATVAAGVFEGLAPVGDRGPQAIVVLPEAAMLERALAGTPADPRFPAGFETPSPGPIPAIVSQSLVDSPRGVRIGDTFQMRVQGYNLTYRAAEARASFPGLPSGRHFVVIAREAFLGQAPPAPVAPVYAIVAAPTTAAADLEAAVEQRSPTVAVTAQAAVADALRDQPVTNAIRSLVLAAAIVTAAYAALGVAAALALAGLQRTTETAQLRTLGLTARQTLQLTVAEHGPTTLAAFVLGALLGVGLFALLRQGLGLEALVGSPVDVPLSFEAIPLLLILVGMIVVVGAGLLLGVILQRRVAPAAAVRGRFE